MRNKTIFAVMLAVLLFVVSVGADEDVGVDIPYDIQSDCRVDDILDFGDMRSEARHYDRGFGRLAMIDGYKTRPVVDLRYGDTATFRVRKRSRGTAYVQIRMLDKPGVDNSFLATEMYGNRFAYEFEDTDDNAANVWKVHTFEYSHFGAYRLKALGDGKDYVDWIRVLTCR